MTVQPKLGYSICCHQVLSLNTSLQCKRTRTTTHECWYRGKLAGWDALISVRCTQSPRVGRVFLACEQHRY